MKQELSLMKHKSQTQKKQYMMKLEKQSQIQEKELKREKEQEAHKRMEIEGHHYWFNHWISIAGSSEKFINWGSRQDRENN